MQNDTIIPANANRIEVRKTISEYDMMFSIGFFEDADLVDVRGFSFRLTNSPQHTVIERYRLNRFNEQFKPITDKWDKVVMTDKLVVYIRPDVLANA